MTCDFSNARDCCECERPTCPYCTGEAPEYQPDEPPDYYWEDEYDG